jgi:hypothetical protein
MALRARTGRFTIMSVGAHMADYTHDTHHGNSYRLRRKLRAKTHRSIALQAQGSRRGGRWASPCRDLELICQHSCLLPCAARCAMAPRAVCQPAAQFLMRAIVPPVPLPRRELSAARELATLFPQTFLGLSRPLETALRTCPRYSKARNFREPLQSSRQGSKFDSVIKMQHHSW